MCHSYTITLAVLLPLSNTPFHFLAPHLNYFESKQLRLLTAIFLPNYSSVIETQTHSTSPATHY